jgi:outer membrane protein OmpA-like peptidoglycan-associated protein
MKAHIFTQTILALALFPQMLHAQPGSTGGPAPVTVQVKNEEAINTAGLEFSPTFFEDGIVFISTNVVGIKKKTDEGLKLPAMSILRSRRNAEGALAAPELFAKELSSIGAHEGPVCFDRTTETVYFSRNAIIDGKDRFAKDKEQKTRIYMSKKSGGTWSEPTPLPFNNNEFDDFHPVISIDGDKLFFASNRPGGYGSTDIYVSYRIGDSWSEPVNLGEGVNTKGKEAFPFIHADNTLYYASDGLEGGTGGFDMYYVVPDEGNKWTKPVNMGTPFNTAGDDFGLIVDLNKINGYYSTNGSGGKGGDEIFSFHTENGNLDDYLLQNKRVPDRMVDIKVLVTDKASGAAIAEADVQILNYDGNNVIGRDEAGNLITIQNVNGQDVIGTMAPDKGNNGITDRDGNYATEVKAGNYVVIASKKGYQTKQIRLPLSKPGNVVKIQLERSSMAAGKIQWNPTAFNYMTNAPLSGAMFVLTNEATGQQDTVIADANGMVDHYLDPNTRYKVDMYQGGRLIGSTEVDTHGAVAGKPLSQNISVAPMLPGTVVELPNIYYNFNDATLRPDARKDLDLVVSLMRQQPSITIEVGSHTDCRGSDYYNQELSQRRANGVVQYLVSQGIERNRVKPIGYGESEPRNICQDGVSCTEQDHARNRRTEIKMLTGMQGSAMVYVNGQVGSPKPISPDVAAPLPAQVNKPGPVKVTNAERDSYYVVAGSFLMENRARNQAGTLQAAGFGPVEIIRFPGSSFHSVCVGRFDSRREAEALERRLEQENIDAFVRAVQ